MANTSNHESISDFISKYQTQNDLFIEELKKFKAQCLVAHQIADEFKAEVDKQND